VAVDIEALIDEILADENVPEYLITKNDEERWRAVLRKYLAVLDEPEEQVNTEAVNDRPSLAETVARWKNSSKTDPTWRGDYA